MNGIYLDKKNKGKNIYKGTHYSLWFGFLIKEYISVKRSIYLHYMARNNKLKMSKHKGLTAIDKKKSI